MSHGVHGYQSSATTPQQTAEDFFEGVERGKDRFQVLNPSELKEISEDLSKIENFVKQRKNAVECARNGASAIPEDVAKAAAHIRKIEQVASERGEREKPGGTTEKVQTVAARKLSPWGRFFNWMQGVFATSPTELYAKSERVRGEIVHFRKEMETQTLADVKTDRAYPELESWSRSELGQVERGARDRAHLFLPISDTEKENRKIAWERMQQCLSGASRELDLSGLGLTYFPASFFDFFEIKKLEKIDLSGNNLQALPVGIHSAPNLQIRNDGQLHGRSIH